MKLSRQMCKKHFVPGYCPQCASERKQKKNKRVSKAHDSNRNFPFFCAIHGPHTVVYVPFDKDYFCAACGPLSKKNIARKCAQKPCMQGCDKCYYCEKESKKQQMIKIQEERSAESLPETAEDLLGEIEKICSPKTGRKGTGK
jgi:hypothetical protein